MRNIVTLGLILFLGINCFGQKLTLTDLQNISNKTNWEYINQYLINKGWEYYDSKKGSSTKYSTITWSYNKSSYDDKASAWFYLYTFEERPHKINYSVFNKPSYSLIQNSLNSKGYKLTGSEIENNEIISTYTNSKFIIKISTEKRDESQKYSYNNKSITAYGFLLIKKSGIYDPNNGKKIDYYYGDVKQSEYTLKNGKLNGKLTAFHINGNIKKTGNYTNGKANGTFTEYDEQGNLTAEYSMKNDLKSGLLKFYEGNEISYSTTYSNDYKNGQYIEYYYDDYGELYLKQYGQFLLDKKSEAWKLYVIEDGKERLVTFTNYKEGIKNGSFQAVKGDSLITGNYQNDKLNGHYKVYRDFMKMLVGGIIRTDVNDLTLVVDGEYYDGKKSGYWKNYDLSGVLRNEGRYSQDLRTGEWKYYYAKFLDDSGIQLPYSNKLFLIQNFLKGSLDGKTTRYSLLNEEKYPCSEINKNPLDSCTRFVYEKIFETAFYKNDKLNGPFELKDSTNQIIAKGVFINDLKDGKWFRRYTSKDYFIYEEGSYSKGEKEGKWIQYYKKDEISKTFNYKQGKLHGKYTIWIDFNKPRKEKQFSYGKLKELIVYDSLGVKPVNKYEIYEETYNSYKCRRVHYFADGYSSQVYWVKKEIGIDHNWFELAFLIAIKEKSDSSKAYKDGYFKIFDKGNKPIVSGKYFREEKVGPWINYFYDQQVKIELNYENNIEINEKYFTLDGSLFSGKFVFINKDRNIKEIRKIKNGLRNGKTLYINLSTGKKIKKERYKNGIKK